MKTGRLLRRKERKGWIHNYLFKHLFRKNGGWGASVFSLKYSCNCVWGGTSQSQLYNNFIRCSSHGLFAEGVKEIRRVYCAINKIILAHPFWISLVGDFVYERKIKIAQ